MAMAFLKHHSVLSCSNEIHITFTIKDTRVLKINALGEYDDLPSKSSEFST